MKTFVDSQKRTWTIDLTIGAISRVKSLTDGATDLMELARGGGKAQSLYQDLLLNLYTLGSVLWGLCQPQAAKAGLDAEAFAEVFDSDCLSAARTALTEEIADFFDKFQRTQAYSVALRKVTGAIERAGAEATRKVEALELNSISGDGFTTPPAESASTLPL